MPVKNWIALTLSALALPVMLDSLSAQLNERGNSGEGGPVDNLYVCRTINDPALRLECFDREVAQLQIAQANSEVTIIDSDDIREARRGLFGFSLPKLRLFGGEKDGEEEVARITEIEEPITRFSFDRSGKAIFTIQSGATWGQTDSVPVLGNPAIGDIVHIEQGALGSYKAKIDGRRAIRVRRIQ